MASASDQQLILQIQQGRREALAQLFDRYSADLYDFLARLVGDRDQAARLLEEVFTRLPGAVAGLPSRESVRGWLYSLAREAGLTWLRQKGWLDALPPSEEPIPSGLGGDIWRAARTMPAFYRAVLIVQELHALSPTEKARALGVQRTDLPRLIVESRNSFNRQFDAQARAEGRPSTSQIDLERILGLRRRIPLADGSLFGFLPVLVMPDSLQQSLRQKVVQSMVAPTMRPRGQPPPTEEAAPGVTPQPAPIPAPLPQAVTTTTTETRVREDLVPAAGGLEMTRVGIFALAGVALALLCFGLVFFLTQDRTPPVFDRVDPPDGATIPQQPLISIAATYHDDRSIDRTRARFIVDGTDVSALATADEHGIAYSGPLNTGPHTVSVTIYDSANHPATASWRFTVGPPLTPTPTSTSLPTFVPPTITEFATAIILPTQTPLPLPTRTPQPLPPPTQIPPTPTPCLVGITGKAYNDLNNNQTRDVGEPNLAGVVVNLQNAGGQTLAVGISDSFGTYQFVNLQFGTYRVQAAVPSGWYATTPTIVTVNMFGCGAFITLDFGFNQATPTPIPTNSPTTTPIVITATFTPTFTPTPSQTPTLPGPTATPTATPTLTPSITPTLTPTTAQVQAQVTVPGSGNASVSAPCPGGSKVTGGGFSHNGTLEVYQSTLSGNAWLGTARNTTGSPNVLTVYAICVSNVPGTTSGLPQTSPPFISGNSGSAVANCPGSQILTGGGYSTVGKMEVYVDSPQGTNGWEADAQNNTGSPQSLSAIAVCYNGTAVSTIAQLPATVGSLGSGTATIACPSGSIVTGGGYGSVIDMLVSNSSKLANGWQVSAKNNTLGPQTLTVYAICTTF